MPYSRIIYIQRNAPSTTESVHRQNFGIVYKGTWRRIKNRHTVSYNYTKLTAQYVFEYSKFIHTNKKVIYFPIRFGVAKVVHFFLLCAKCYRKFD